jgi:hypothetical protein
VNERERGSAENEILFRDVNERLESLNEAFTPLTDQVVIVCECADIACMERIAMTTAEYEALRADPRTFAIRPRHQAAEVEEVVADRGSYLVVRKAAGEPARRAIIEDPRS